VLEGAGFRNWFSSFLQKKNTRDHIRLVSKKNKFVFTLVHVKKKIKSFYILVLFSDAVKISSGDFTRRAKCIKTNRVLVLLIYD
jgi:hypothetical protein